MLLLSVFYFAQLSVHLQINALSPYCAHPCGEEPHTMCQYPAGGDPRCSSFITDKMTPELRDLLLNTHNSLRQKVALGKEPNQPSASNMMVLAWDKEGESIAQRWAEQCQDISGQGDQCRSKLDGEEGGQNVCIECPEKPFPKSLGEYLHRRVTEWFLLAEALQFTWTEEFVYSEETKSYSQMVWADTRSVGCGFSYNDSKSDSMYRLVCNYYPKGNIETAMIYKKGFACSKCPKGSDCSKTWPGLCTTVPSDMGGKVPPDAIDTEASASIAHLSFSLFIYLIFLCCCFHTI